MGRFKSSRCGRWDQTDEQREGIVIWTSHSPVPPIGTDIQAQVHLLLLPLCVPFVLRQVLGVFISGRLYCFDTRGKWFLFYDFSWKLASGYLANLLVAFL